MRSNAALRLRAFGRGWRAVALAAVLAVTAATLVAFDATQPASAAGSDCGPDINAIACENSKPGTDPDVWDINGAGDASIQGFATDISVDAGDSIDFKIDTNAKAYTIDIYRTGWYQGLGARFIQSVPVTAALPQNQPECISDVATELLDCGTWAVSASWDVPDDAVSGVYVAKLTRKDTGGASHIIFIVRNDGNHSDVVFQTSDPTWQAYNTYGGSDFYQGAANGRAFKISYNRPFATRGNDQGRDFYFASEYATVRFLERNGYDVSYMSGVDVDRFGSQLLDHKVYLSVGHDEYVSGAQRANVEAARDAGVNLQFLSGNEVYWRTRYEPSADPSATPYRTLVSYKETWGNAKIDPADEWTGTWRDPRFAGADQGGTLPENGLTGTIYMSNDTDLPITVSSDEGKLRLWRNTSLTSLAAGTSQPLAAHTIGYESDEDIDNGFRPAGLVRLSTTVGETPQYLTDYGNAVVPGTTEHHLTMYRAPSGALVFGAGTIQWGWGLDQEHDGNGAPADPRMQQAEVNLLADMGAQPTTLMPGLVAATKSTDTTAPVTTITSPAAAAEIVHGSEVTISGTASDAAGRVAGVEVSVDGGATWHPAEGTTNWSYTYIQQGYGDTDLIARAIDDSGNYVTAGTKHTVDVTGPYTVWGSVTPDRPSADDGGAVELGLRFTPSVDGYINGIRFYKGASNTGSHTGTLWTADGREIAQVQFTDETATGWQTASFADPVAASAGTEYVVSYTAPHGGYAYMEDFWPYRAVPSTPLEVQSGVGDASPGVYGGPGEFPVRTFGEANYYVDVTFTSAENAPLAVVARTPQAASTSNALDSVITARFNRAVDPASVDLTVTAEDGTAVAGAVSYDASTKVATFTPASQLAAGTEYTVTPVAADAKGSTLGAGAEWTFTTRTADLPEGTCPCTLFSEGDRPVIDADVDSTTVTLGVAFTPAVDGEISAIKYFKGSRNSGEHTGSLWTEDGRELASVDFDDSFSYGWQTARLSTPVAVTAGETYVASYTAPNGGYSADPGVFSGTYTRGPLTVAAGGGRYTYDDAFPGSASTTSYLVDVVFQQTVHVPELIATSPANGTTDVPVDATISAKFSAAVDSSVDGSVEADGSVVAGEWSRSSDKRSLVFVPDAQLPPGASITVELTGISAEQGAELDDVAWSFTTADANAPVALTLVGDRTPQVTSDGDSAAVELGMAFTTSQPGKVTGIRFYKGAANTGTHVGSLWGPDGEQLARVVFGAESASGWQRASLSSPVALTPGTVYTVSYFAPNGNYSYTSGGFASSVTNGPLSTIAGDNGRFRYGSGDVMPEQTWGSTNYFVDVEFVADDQAPTVVATSPDQDAADVSVEAVISATFDRDLADHSPELSVSTDSGATVAGTSSYDAQTRRLTFTPDADLPAGTVFTATVRVDGSVLHDWTFTTADAESTEPGDGGTEPTDPGDTEPTDPGDTEPTDPGDTEPTDPGSGDPGEGAPVDVAGETIFGDAVPSLPAESEGDAVELGTAFRVTEPGQAIAIRFYKGAGNSGTHVGTLWSGDGRVLSQVTFTGETASGWQRAVLANPVDLVPSETYVVSYYAPQGHYASETWYFTSERGSDRVIGLGLDNGRFRYGAGGGFPADSWLSSSYFVDAEVAFGDGQQPVADPSPDADPTPAPDPSPEADPTPAPDPESTPEPVETPSGDPSPGDDPESSPDPESPGDAEQPGTGEEQPGADEGEPGTGGEQEPSGDDGAPVEEPAPVYAVTDATPDADAEDVAPTTTVTARFDVDPGSAQITLKSGNGDVDGESVYDADDRTVTFTPSTPLAWKKTFTVTVAVADGTVTDGSWTFTTIDAPVVEDAETIFGDDLPQNAAWDDPDGVQVATRFSVNAAGKAFGVRFYKGAANTGDHTGYLWDDDGNKLAEVAFSGETADGWQTAMFAAPVELEPGVEYRVGLYSTTGRYAVDLNGLANGLTVGDFEVPSQGAAYTYSKDFPDSLSSHNYWVDVLFEPTA